MAALVARGMCGPPTALEVGTTPHHPPHLVFGVICDDGWDKNAADVVCKQLGFGAAAEVFDHSQFGDVESDSFSYDEISCSGSEAHVQV